MGENKNIYSISNALTGGYWYYQYYSENAIWISQLGGIALMCDMLRK